MVVFPAPISLRSAREIEEERRLLYVAVTRSKDRLYLLKPDRLGNRGFQFADLTRFLSEIPRLVHLVEDHRPSRDPLAGATRKTEPRGSDSRSATSAEEQERLDRIKNYFS